jgi:hypothetical protein
MGRHFVNMGYRRPITHQALPMSIPITHQDAPEPPHHPSRRVSEPHHPSRRVPQPPIKTYGGWGPGILIVTHVLIYYKCLYYLSNKEASLVMFKNSYHVIYTLMYTTSATHRNSYRSRSTSSTECTAVHSESTFIVVVQPFTHSMTHLELS